MTAITHKLFLLSLIFFGLIGQALTQETCTELDSALFLFSQSFNKSISIKNNSVDLKQRVCFSIYIENDGATLKSILSETNLAFNKTSRGYTIIKDKSKQLIYGQILNKDTKAPIPFAIFYDPELNNGSYADKEGRFYYVRPSQSSENYQITCVGYKPKNVKIQKTNLGKSTIYLEPDDILPELIVDEFTTTNAQRGIINTDPFRKIPFYKLYHEASVMGQADVLQYMKLYPEVQATSDGISAIRVRGGSPDQNLVLMNDVPLYHHSHGLGLHSVFNPTNVDFAALHTGYFPANYQGKNSSVIVVDNKQGDLENHHVRADISPLGASISVEGPILQDKVSFVVSGRYTDVGSIQKKIEPNRIEGKIKSRSLDASYSDINASIFIKLSDKTNLELGGFRGKDELIDESIIEQISGYYYGYYYYYYVQDRTFDEKYNWINKNVFAKFETEISNSLIFNFQAFASGFSYTSKVDDFQDDGYGNTLLSSEFKTEINEAGAKFNLSFPRKSSLIDAAGMHLTTTNYTPGEYSFHVIDTIRLGLETLQGIPLPRIPESDSLSSQDVNIYLEKKLRLRANLNLNLGLAAVWFHSNGYDNQQIQPRFGVNYQPFDKLEIIGSTGLMGQHKHLLSASNNGLPNDLWLPANSDFPVQESFQSDLIVRSTILKNITMELSGFYKKQKNLVRLRDELYNLGGGQANLDASFWREIATTGERKAVGSSFYLKYASKNIDINSSYTYSKTNERYLNYINGDWVPNLYHRDHQANASIIWRPMDKLSIVPAFTFGSPATLTLPEGIYEVHESTDPNNSFEDIYFGKFEYETPAFQRMDFTVNYVMPSKRFIHRFKASIFNIFNIKNFTHYVFTDTGTIDEYTDLFVYDIGIQHGPSRIISFNYAISF